MLRKILIGCFATFILGLCCSFRFTHRAQGPTLTIEQSKVSIQPVSILTTELTNGQLSLIAKNDSPNTVKYVSFKVGPEEFKAGRNDLSLRRMNNQRYLAMNPELVWKSQEVRTFTFPFTLTKSERIVLRIVLFDNGTGWMDGFAIRKAATPYANGLLWDVDDAATQGILLKKQSQAKPRTGVSIQPVSYKKAFCLRNPHIHGQTCPPDGCEVYYLIFESGAPNGWR